MVFSSEAGAFVEVSAEPQETVKAARIVSEIDIFIGNFSFVLISF
jgi:hypothetical protein